MKKSTLQQGCHVCNGKKGFERNGSITRGYVISAPKGQPVSRRGWKPTEKAQDKPKRTREGYTASPASIVKLGRPFQGR
jgi:hypothetical protein